jgi:hypothetical protein
LAQNIPKEALTYQVTNPYRGDLSNYTIMFESGIPINLTSKCFVKYTFPDQIDISNLDLTDIEANGMFFDKSKLVFKHNLNSTGQSKKYIVLQGCGFNPELNSPDDISYDVFNVTFKNLRNP